MPSHPGLLTYLYFGYIGFGNFLNSAPNQLIKKCPSCCSLGVWMPPSRNLSKHEDDVRDDLHAQTMGTKAQWPHIFSYVFVKRILFQKTMQIFFLWSIIVSNTMEIQSSAHNFFPHSYTMLGACSSWSQTHKTGWLSLRSSPSGTRAAGECWWWPPHATWKRSTWGWLVTGNDQNSSKRVYQLLPLVLLSFQQRSKDMSAKHRSTPTLLGKNLTIFF